MKRDKKNLIGKLIQALVDETGLRQEDVANAIGDGVHQGHLSRWVTGQHSPTAYRLIQILRACNVPLPIDIDATSRKTDEGRRVIELARELLGDPEIPAFAERIGIAELQLSNAIRGSGRVPACILLAVLRAIDPQHWPSLIHAGRGRAGNRDCSPKEHRPAPLTSP